MVGLSFIMIVNWSTKKQRREWWNRNGLCGSVDTRQALIIVSS